MSYDRIQKVVQALQYRKKQDFDTVVVVTGEEGVGKTSLAIRLAMETDPDFDMEANMIYKPEEALKKLPLLKKGASGVFDEGGELAYSLDFQKILNKTLKKLMMKIRFMNHTLFICIPNFWQLDKYYRDARVAFWIHVIDRGACVVFKRSKNPFKRDLWFRKETEDKLDYYVNTHSPVDSQIRGFMRAKTYYDHFKFPKLDDRIEAKYKELSFARKLEHEAMEAPGVVVSKRLVKMIANRDKWIKNSLGADKAQGMTLVRLGKKYEMSQGQLDKYLNGDTTILTTRQ